MRLTHATRFARLREDISEPDQQQAEKAYTQYLG